MIVVDASTLVKYLLHEDSWEQVSRYLKERRPLYPVDHVLKECSNTIWRHCYIRKLIDSVTALDLLRKLIGIIEAKVIVVEAEATYLERALEISLNSRLPVYDSLYIAQAEKYGELLTSDRRQAESARSLGVTVHLVE